MAVSWSEMQTFMECNRKWWLRYGEGLEPKGGDDGYNRLLGSAFHAGMAEYADTLDIGRAIQSASEYLSENTQATSDQEYLDMVNNVHSDVYTMLRYYLPRTGIGTQYRVALVGELFPDAPDADARMVEWSFHTDKIKGTIDAVLFDNETEEYVLVDWKTRSSFPFDDAAHLDGQLHLYIAALKVMTDAPLNRAIMWQFKVKTPAPASISKVNNLPNTGAASYDTTWEEWCRTLPDGIKPEKYETLMRPKLKTDDDFMRKTEILITPQSVYNTVTVTQGVLSQMENVGKLGMAEPMLVPAIQSVHACKMCPFYRLCGGVLRYGGDVEEAKTMFYNKRETR